MNKTKIAKELLLLAKEITNNQEEFTNFIISKNEIKITSKTKVYMNVRIAEFEVINDRIEKINSKIEKIKALAKRKKIKIINLDEKIKEANQLIKQVKKYYASSRKLFDKLYKLWKKMEKKKNLFSAKDKKISEVAKKIPEFGQAVEIKKELQETEDKGSRAFIEMNKLSYEFSDALTFLKRRSSISKTYKII